MSRPKITPTRTHRLGTDGLLQPFARLWAWLKLCFAPGAHQAPAIRCGLLDTGELVLVDAWGQAQTFSPATTALIRTTVVAGRIDPLPDGGAHIVWPDVPKVAPGHAPKAGAPAPSYSWS